MKLHPSLRLHCHDGPEIPLEILSSYMHDTDVSIPVWTSLTLYFSFSFDQSSIPYFHSVQSIHDGPFKTACWRLEEFVTRPEPISRLFCCFSNFSIRSAKDERYRLGRHGRGFPAPSLTTVNPEYDLSSYSYTEVARQLLQRFVASSNPYAQLLSRRTRSAFLSDRARACARACALARARARTVLAIRERTRSTIPYYNIAQ